MKISVDIDCTPEEMRRFFGLPDVTPLQDAFVKEMEKRMSAGLQSMDAEALLKAWLPSSMESWDRLQKNFWQQMGAAAAGMTAGKARGPSGKEKE